MELNFHRPVYTGESITCRSTYDTVVERDDHYEFTTEIVCEKADDETVLTGSIEGLIRKDT